MSLYDTFLDHADLEPEIKNRYSIIFYQGSIVKHLYLVLDGFVWLNRTDVTGKSVHVGAIGRRQFFGETILLGDGVANYTARVPSCRTTIQKLEKRKFELCMKETEVNKAILSHVCSNYHQALARLEISNQKTLEIKLRDTLLFLANEYGIDQYNGVRIPFSVTEVSKLMGSARESISRKFSKLVYNKYIIKDPCKHNRDWIITPKFFELFK